MDLLIENVALFTFVKNLVYVSVAFAAIMSVLSYLDHRIKNKKGSHFDKVIDSIHSTPLSTAVYYGARFVGVCLLLAHFISG